MALIGFERGRDDHVLPAVLAHFVALQSRRARQAGGVPVVVAVAGEGEHVRAVAMDATDLYFAETTGDHCALRKVPR